MGVLLIGEDVVRPSGTDEAEVLVVGLTVDRGEAREVWEAPVLGLLFREGGTGEEVLGCLLRILGGADVSFTPDGPGRNGAKKTGLGEGAWPG